MLFIKIKLLNIYFLKNTTFALFAPLRWTITILPIATIPSPIHVEDKRGRPSSAQYTRYNTYALCPANGRDAKSCVSTTYNNI